MSENLRDIRLEKLNQVRDLGVEPYGSRYEVTGTVAEILALHNPDDEGGEVRAAGRVTALRGHGKAAFFDLRDHTGRIQAYAKLNVLGDEKFGLFQLVDIGDILGVRGKLQKTRTGEITVFADDLTMLAKSLRPLPEKWHGLTDVEIRYRQRYLDLIANEASVQTFVTRSRIIRSIRSFLDERGFMEVETPMMQTIPGGAVARPFVTHHNALGIDLYLRIAPELYLKRLLVGGLGRVYEINRNFRNEGISTRHNPEFTMVEVYQAYADYRVMMQLTEELVLSLAEELGLGNELAYGEMTIDVTPPWRQVAYGELLHGVGLSIDEPEQIVARARELGIDTDGRDAEAVTDDVFEKLIQPSLVNPTFVTEYPSALCPLSKTKPDDPSIAERFELFVAGMECANAYSELNDPIDQDRRFRAQVEKAVEGAVEVDTEYVQALEHGMPPAGGLGIGIDRLVMLLTNNPSIRDVVLFPLLRPDGGKASPAAESE